MNFRELIRIILSNLSRMKFRVALTAAGVLIGTFAVILLVSVGSGLQAIVNSSFGSVGELTQVQVYNFSFDGAATDTEPITRKVLNEWRGLNGVTAVTPVVDIQAGSEFVLNRYVVSGRTLGLDRTQVEKLGYEMVEGSGKLNNG
ncbi:MAG: ABC transporter permease, partial [Chloroflexota bacterium]